MSDFPGHHRTKFRKQANAADNKGATVAVDSLINYEAVKVGGLRTTTIIFLPLRRSSTFAAFQ
jgi:ABC-type transport system involved in Fe-S cluster assembly fused permease/ATPase subunit